MTHDTNDAHQMRIRKLQERLSGISSEFRKNLVTEIQNKKQNDVGNIYSATMPLSTQRQQKQSHETEKESSVQEILQQIKQQVEHKRLETINTMETQQKQISSDNLISKNLKIQDLDQSLPKQNVVQDNKSWQLWKYIPQERLNYLEKKKLKFFKKQ